MNLLKSFLILIALYCIPLFSYSQAGIIQDSVNDRLGYFIATDSVYKATLLLKENIAYAKSNKLPVQLASSLRSLGHIFSNISSHESAELHYKEAFHIYDSLNKKEDIDDLLTKMVRNYVNGGNYEKFDSLIPSASKHSEQLNSINQFYNLESQLLKNYFIRRYDISLSISDRALQKIEDYDFSTEFEKKEKQRLTEFFKYHHAIALIHLKKEDEGYALLFKIDPEKFGIRDQDYLTSISQIATLNYYKFKYYNEREKQLDSATKYLLRSDQLKYMVIKHFQERLSKNDNLIQKIFTTEKQLQLAQAQNEYHKKSSNLFLIMSTVLSLSLLLFAIFFYFYYNNKKQLKTANSRLSQSNKKLKIIDKERLEFFSILSHELRTPIYGISGLATLIKQEENPEKSKENLNALTSSSQYISMLIDNVLQVSTMKFEKKCLHLKPTNILQLIKKISDSIKISADQKNLKLYTNLEKTNWDEYLLVDTVVLTQILANLTYNAIRYTKEGFVSINVTEQKRTDTHVNLLFEIKDSGIGIQNKHRDIIFNAFENRTFLKKNSTGSGLGLYIVKTLLKSYNSEIKFSSKVDEGSNFYFDIDFKIAQIHSENEQTQFFDEIQSKILIVDDNSINLMITQKNVQKIPGCFSETTKNGRKAISLVKEKDYDLVLMDINMPDMDGFEATKHIRLFNPDIPILALTALNSEEILTKAKASGMNHVITKPYDFGEFKSVILKYLQVLQE